MQIVLFRHVIIIETCATYVFFYYHILWCFLHDLIEKWVPLIESYLLGIYWNYLNIYFWHEYFLFNFYWRYMIFVSVLVTMRDKLSLDFYKKI